MPPTAPTSPTGNGEAATANDAAEDPDAGSDAKADAAAAAAASLSAAAAAAVEVAERSEEGVAALQLQSQAAATLAAAMDAALSVQDWALAERASYELARCYGQQAPALACRSLAVAQACRAAAAGQALLRSAAPAQQPEVLALAQRDALAAALPVPGDNPHYAALRRVLVGLRSSVARLDVAVAPSVEKQLQSLPQVGRLSASGDVPGCLPRFFPSVVFRFNPLPRAPTASSVANLLTVRACYIFAASSPRDLLLICPV